MWSPQAPIQLLCDDKLSDGDKIVVIAILSHLRPEDGRMACWPSNARLAEITGKPEGTVKRILWKLRGLSYVRSATDVERETYEIPGRARSIVLDLPYIPKGFTDETEGITDETPDVSKMKPEETKKKNGLIKNEYIDEIINHVNRVTNRTYRTGPNRSKDLAKKIKSRIKEMYSEHKDMEKALIQVKCVADEKMIQSRERNPGTGRPRFSEDWVKPSTLYRASNFFEYLEEARQRARKHGDVVWFRRGS